MAQSEAALQFLLPALYEQAINGVTGKPRPVDALDPWGAPVGVFKGSDSRWVAVDASANDAWHRWRASAGPEFDDARFATIIGRLRHRADLDRVVGEWIAARPAATAEAELQQIRVPAHIVTDAAAFAADEDFRNEMILKVADPPGLDVEILAGSFRLRRRILRRPRRGPRVGEHTAEILSEVCGLRSSEIAALDAAGVLR